MIEQIFKYLFTGGFICAAIGALMLYDGRKRDGRTRTGIKNNEPDGRNVGLGFKFLAIGLVVMGFIKLIGQAPSDYKDERQQIASDAAAAAAKAEKEAEAVAEASALAEKKARDAEAARVAEAKERAFRQQIPGRYFNVQGRKYGEVIVTALDDDRISLTVVSTQCDVRDREMRYDPEYHGKYVWTGDKRAELSARFSVSSYDGGFEMALDEFEYRPCDRGVTLPIGRYRHDEPTAH